VIKGDTAKRQRWNTVIQIREEKTYSLNKTWSKLCKGIVVGIKNDEKCQRGSLRRERKGDSTVQRGKERVRFGTEGSAQKSYKSPSRRLGIPQKLIRSILKGEQNRHANRTPSQDTNTPRTCVEKRIGGSGRKGIARAKRTTLQALEKKKGRSIPITTKRQD